MKRMLVERRLAAMAAADRFSEGNEHAYTAVTGGDEDAGEGSEAGPGRAKLRKALAHYQVWSIRWAIGYGRHETCSRPPHALSPQATLARSEKRMLVRLEELKGEHSRVGAALTERFQRVERCTQWIFSGTSHRTFLEWSRQWREELAFAERHRRELGLLHAAPHAGGGGGSGGGDFSVESDGEYRGSAKAGETSRGATAEGSAAAPLALAPPSHRPLLAVAAPSMALVERGVAAEVAALLAAPGAGMAPVDRAAVAASAAAAVSFPRIRGVAMGDSAQFPYRNKGLRGALGLQMGEKPAASGSWAVGEHWYGGSAPTVVPHYLWAEGGYDSGAPLAALTEGGKAGSRAAGAGGAWEGGRGGGGIAPFDASGGASGFAASGSGASLPAGVAGLRLSSASLSSRFSAPPPTPGLVMSGPATPQSAFQAGEALLLAPLLSSSGLTWTKKMAPGGGHKPGRLPKTKFDVPR
jgi:hypothetical protein